jgi:hypothetical protein
VILVRRRLRLLSLGADFSFPRFAGSRTHRQSVPFVCTFSHLIRLTLCSPTVIIAIIVSSCSSKSSGGGGGSGAPTVAYGPTGGSGSGGGGSASRPQTINMSQAPAQPATVAASLARKPGRSAKKQYNRLEEASSEGELSSGESSGLEDDEDAAAYEQRARQRVASSARAGSGRSRSDSMASLGHARSTSRSGRTRSSSRASVSRSASRSSRR